MQPVEHALQYAAASWPVFPCCPQSKAPLVSRGLHSATTREHIIRRWWQDHPSAMIGVPTGEASGFWVLDVDTKDDGPAQLIALEGANEPLPPTVTARTPSGGFHILFRYPSAAETPVRNRGRLAPGLDVRGEGGYVIAPGSVKDDGTYYEWAADDETDIADAPEWLLAKVARPAPGEPTNTPTTTGAPNEAYVDAAIADELGKLASTRAGRNNAINDSAFSLGQFVGAGALSHAEAESRLFAAAVANGYVAKDGEHAARATIRSGLESGASYPRDVPEAPDTQHDEALVAEGARLAAALLKGAPVDGTAEPPPPIQATPWEWKDPATIPRRQWLYGRHYVRKYLSLTVAPGGIGKSSLAVSEALAMITGKHLLGDKPADKCRVWYFNGEDDSDELDRRIAATCKRFGVRPKELQGRLYVDSGREQSLVVMWEENRSLKIAHPIVDAVKATIQANEIDALIVDPFVSTHGVPENDNGAIDKVAKLWAKIADETDCAVEVIHHVKKVDGREVAVEDARGAGALIAAARSVRVLNRMTDEQASQAGVQLAERPQYFSVQVGKSNMATLGDSQVWRYLESVDLGNGGAPYYGGGLQKPQDHVGVVTEWRWPSAEEIAAEVPADALEAIKRQIAAGTFRENEQASDWAGVVVADVLGVDIADKTQKRRVKALLKAWLEAGHFEVRTVRHPVARENKKCVVVAGQEQGCIGPKEHNP